jgi:hypothetical protein
MADLQLRVIDDRPPIIVRALRAALPIPFGLLFVYIGWTKFDTQSMWVQIFDRMPRTVVPLPHGRDADRGRSADDPSAETRRRPSGNCSARAVRNRRHVRR